MNRSVLAMSKIITKNEGYKQPYEDFFRSRYFEIQTLQRPKCMSVEGRLLVDNHTMY